MADHAKPTLSSTYTDFLAQLDARMKDLAAGLDPAKVSVTNPPDNSVRWTSAAAKWQIWNGSTWIDLAAEYAININGSAVKLKTARAISITGGATAAAVNFDGSGNVALSVTTLDATKLTGTASVNTTGNAATATKLATARSFQVSGDVTTASPVDFDGSGNVNISVTIPKLVPKLASAPLTDQGPVYVIGTGPMEWNAGSSAYKTVFDDSTLVKKAGDTLTGGFKASSSYNIGNMSGATVTLDPANGNIQHCAKNGSGTLNAPTAAGVYTMIVQVTNTSATGALTLSGFTKVTGDALTADDTHKFIVSVAKTNDYTVATVQAMQ